jgi:hypothetical protein
MFGAPVTSGLVANRSSEDRVGAEREVPRGLRDVEADPRLEPLALLVDQGDQRDRGLAHVGGEEHQVVVELLRDGVEHVVLAQRGEPLALVGGQRGGAGAVGLLLHAHGPRSPRGGSDRCTIIARRIPQPGAAWIRGD